MVSVYMYMRDMRPCRVSVVTRGVWVVSQARREKDGKSVKDDPRRSRATPPDVFSDTGEGL